MRLLSIVIVWLLWAVPVWAQPVVIGTPTSANSGATAALSLTFSANCPNTGTNRMAVVCVNAQRNLGNDVIAAATWNGSAMTSVGSIGSGAEVGFAQMFRLLNPTCDGSAHNVVITLTTNSHYFTGHVLFLSGVHQTTPFDTPATAVGTTADPSVVVTGSATTDLVIDCVGSKNSNIDIVAGAGQTGTVNQTTNATASTNVEGGQSYEAGATSVTMSWSRTPTPVGWSIIGASANPIASTTRRRFPPRYYNKAPVMFPFVFVTYDPQKKEPVYENPLY